MPKDDKQYKKMADKYSPGSPLVKDCLKAFVAGGIICTVAQGIHDVFKSMGISEEDCAIWTSIVMVLIGTILTGLGWYAKIAKHAGAGTLVPITGFANSVVSPAIEYKTEGMITGIAAKMFIISGPVIVYGVFSAWICGIIKWIIGVI